MVEAGRDLGRRRRASAPGFGPTATVTATATAATRPSGVRLAGSDTGGGHRASPDTVVK
ncbi:hypothetical protein [Actinomadura gamaensis]|uniref:Uncharacterized protein n=1 Tax=Actinomadura gamaensis TaxID=1763541 RepID=A0ABV9TZ48_9ACTN